ncbi:hypothetical protein pb186bvf_016025 [Paramecium bursaria]
MEKFRKFADPQTGINVFLPAYSNPKTTLIDRLLHSTLGIVLIIIRVPIIFVLILTSLIIDKLLQLIIIQSLKRKIRVITFKIIYRTVLHLVGVYKIDHQDFPSQVNDDQKCLILSNHSSPLDVFFLLQQSAPNFIRIHWSDNEIKFSSQTLWQTIKGTFIEIQPSLDSNGSTLKDILSSQTPAILFFEGCQTNQNGILVPHTNLIQQIQAIQPFLNIYFIKYKDRTLFTPINTVRNYFWHFIILCTNISNGMKVDSVDTEKQSNYANFIKIFYDSHNMKLINQDWKQFIEFKEYYLQTIKASSYKKID